MKITLKPIKEDTVKYEQKMKEIEILIIEDGDKIIATTKNGQKIFEIRTEDAVAGDDEYQEGIYFSFSPDKKYFNFKETATVPLEDLI